MMASPPPHFQKTTKLITTAVVLYFRWIKDIEKLSCKIWSKLWMVTDEDYIWSKQQCTIWNPSVMIPINLFSISENAVQAPTSQAVAHSSLSLVTVSYWIHWIHSKRLRVTKISSPPNKRENVGIFPKSGTNLYLLLAPSGALGFIMGY